MSNVHIITDSCAQFSDAQILEKYPITVVPNSITIGGKTYKEGIDIDAFEAIKLIDRYPTPPIVTPPTESDYARVYSQVAKQSDAIISIHGSRELFDSWYKAQQAAQPLVSHGNIAVIDSQLIDVAQGILVEYAAQQAQQISNFEELVRKVRGAIERIYAMYFTESTGYLMQNKLMSPEHGVLSTMFGLKPFVTIEDGHIILVEKVRTRTQAIERVIEFSSEFDNIQTGYILQSQKNSTENTHNLQNRLASEFNGRHFPHILYGATMASLIGTDATGFVIVEDEAGIFDEY